MINNNSACSTGNYYDCYDTSTTTIYVVNNKITFEYLDGDSYKEIEELVDLGHGEYMNQLTDYEDYTKISYTKDYYIRLTISNQNEVIYTKEDFAFNTKNEGATTVDYTFVGKDETKENSYIYKVLYTFKEKNADTTNYSETTVTLPDGSTKILRYYSEEAYDCYNACKPVLYLYPKTTTNITVTLKHPSYITTSYPKYNAGWQVTAEPNGNLIDLNGNSYYALYWDEKYYTSKENRIDFKTGFYVEKSNAINFLEEKLKYIGLNDKESNEFIMYWLPILEKNEKSLVYFEQTEEREQNSKLNIVPTPDSLLRVLIHVKKVNGKTIIKEQQLVPFNRQGFAAVEWGGVNHS